ncbi:MAG: DUF2065 domain-containing protein [Thermodesulfobacteriota bacterium]
MTFLLSILGLLLIVEGIPYFAFPVKTKDWARTLQDIPQRSLRIMGFIAMLFGLLLLYAARLFSG